MTRRRDVWLGGGLAVAVIAVYARSLGVGFYSDDYQWLGRMAPTLENPLYMFRIFYRDFNPLLHFSFLVDWLAGDGGAFAFHLSSLAVHVACTVMLFALCRRFTGNVWVAVAAALTWGLNRRLSEAVIWPAARGHSLAAMWVLAALLCLGSGSPRRRAVAVPLFLLALMSKEVALFPLLLAPLFLADLWRSRRLVAVLWGLAGAFVAFNFLFKPTFHLSNATASELLLKVPFILLRPLGLGDLYDFSPLMCALVLAAFVLVGLLLFSTPARTGLLWVGLCAVPVIPLDKLSSRYLYLLSIGYALVLCGAFEPVAARLSSRVAKRSAAVAGIVALVLVLAAGIVLIQREIDDYALLSEPYARCLDGFLEEVATLEPGQTLLVLDVGARAAVPGLQERISERGNMSKLIPYRPGGIDGLIELADIVNTIRGGEAGMFGVTVAPPAPSSAGVRTVLYDGERTRAAGPLGDYPVVPDRVFAVRWGSSELFFAREKSGVP